MEFWYDRSSIIFITSIISQSLPLSPECQQNLEVTDEEKVGRISGSEIATSVALSFKLPQLYTMGHKVHKVQKKPPKGQKQTNLIK